MEQTSRDVRIKRTFRIILCTLKYLNTETVCSSKLDNNHTVLHISCVLFALVWPEVVCVLSTSRLCHLKEW